jgi:phosphohistidine swiveling domain-containing protein
MNPAQRASVLELAAADDYQVAGRKAATLSRLRRAGFPVPPGVVVAASVRDAESDGAVPPDVATPLLDAVQAWGDIPLAVRSSGVDEDSGEASFAGIFTTVLDVRGRQALLGAVATCWASARDDRVTSYAGEGGAGLAVLVQPLVPAVAAGVAFTADPVTGRRDVVVIDAVAGLGERLVSGEATPERWTMEKNGRATRRSTAGDAVLDEASVGAIAELARNVEAELGGPQDVEWAIDPAGSVVLLQARPITALPEEPLPVPVEVPEGYWEREESHQVLPWTPLTASFMPERNSVLRRMANELGLLFDGVEFRNIGGWEYLRIVPLGGKEPPPLPKALVPLVLRLAPPVRKRLRDAEKAIRDDVPGSLIRRWYEEWQPGFDARGRALRAVRLTDLDDGALADHVRAVTELIADGFDVHFRLHGAIAVTLADLCFTCRDVLGWDDAQALALVSGTSTTSTRPARALADVAAKAGPQVRELVRTGAPVDVVMAADAGFAESFRSYVEEYCCRVLAYEIAEPSLEERPELVLALVRDQLTAGFDPAAMQEERRDGRAQVQAVARDRLRGEDLARFERVLERALRAYPVREDNEFYTVSAPLALLRRAVLEIGRRAAGRGVLAAPEDVFMLTFDEVLALLAEGSLDADLVTRRRRERAWVMGHPGPASFGKPPGPPPPLDKLPEAARLINGAFLWAIERIIAPNGGTTPTDGVVSGIPASPGRYTGPVRVIRSEAEFDRLRAGDVLVCPQTSPVWSVLFPSVGALVTDHGGTLSHPAIIAREYGVPAVVATGGATAVLREGQVVTVDGSAGTVEVVSGR